MTTKQTTLTLYLRDGQPPVDDAGKQWRGAYTYSNHSRRYHEGLERLSFCPSCTVMNYNKRNSEKLCDSCKWAARSCWFCDASRDGIPIYTKERTRKGVCASHVTLVQE
jgi:hypothetical protein